MGRLTLNILLSFAQFEREVIGERIRDKFAASRRKGIWMGGWAPLGYDVKSRKLVVNEAQAAVVREIFRRYAKLESPSGIVRDLAARGVVNKYGKPIHRAMLYTILKNRTYVGEASHKGTAYPGEHKPIIDRKLWDQVQQILTRNPSSRGRPGASRTPALLKGLIFGPNGQAMSPTHTRKGNRIYRYYVSQSATKTGPEGCPVSRVPAGEIEAAVIGQLRTLLRSPEVVVATWRAARKEIKDLNEREVRAALEQLDPLWDELFPAERARIVQLLVERVDVGVDGLDIQLRVDGFQQLVTELDRRPLGEREAA